MSKIDATNVLDRIGEKDVLLCAHKVWPNEYLTALRIASEASNVIRQACRTDPKLFTRKSEKGIVGGLFYLLGRRCGSTRTQRQIARSLNTTEITIGDCCRLWVEPLQNYSRHRTRERRSADVNRRSLKKLA